MYGDEASQKKLVELVEQSKDNKDKELSKAIQFYKLEDAALDAGLNAKTEDLPAKLEELKKYFAAEARARSPASAAGLGDRKDHQSTPRR